jgi:SAM-dependent methyltransferase
MVPAIVGGMAPDHLRLHEAEMDGASGRGWRRWRSADGPTGYYRAPYNRRRRELKSQPGTSDREVWDRHWHELQAGDATFFGRLASLVRKRILAGAVRRYTERWFPGEGVLVEAGCGTAESSAGVLPRQRRCVGLDFSFAALLAARGAPPHRWLVRADIHALPFADDSLAGIWNLGVMEHFEPDDGRAILRELARALAPGAAAILFWPPELGLSRLVLAPIELLRSRPGKPFRFFPDEVNRLRTLEHGRRTLREGGLEPVAVDFTWRDAFIHFVAVGRKPAAGREGPHRAPGI